MELHLTTDQFRLAQTFTISRGSRDIAEVVTVTLRDGDHRGWGECLPYARYEETLDSVSEQIESMRGDLANGIDRLELINAMPAGAARNAIDCALWDLEAKRSKTPVWRLAGISEPSSVVSAYTLSLETPDKMRATAAEHAFRPLLKIKLGGTGDIERLRAVREGAPESTLIVDANEGWTAQTYDELAPVMLDLGVSMVEQPLPAASDSALSGRDRPLPVCADESCHDTQSLDQLGGKYDMVNIKLDKTGGLTEALRLRDHAQAAGFQVMVGCMVCSSLAMAPALLVAQGADVVDLDGPLLLAEDRTPAMQFVGSELNPAPIALWG
ncbi:MAG: dipeptide epimerase [Gammaproteobacteria bacterium]|nr:dipeptide epimerase [Gammaproteobacteria bacterium]